MALADSRSDRSIANASIMGRALAAAYGLTVYVFFFATFLYVIGWVAGFGVPKTMDDGALTGVGTALLINALLLGIFAIQHTIMARPAFKRRWTRIVPQQVERTTFVMITCAILVLMVVEWRPLPELVWRVDGAAAVALYAIAALGWAIVLISTFLIDHFELFGVKQSLAYAAGRPARPAQFRERLFYRWVRHPLMLGFLIAFWATPVMSQGHLFFALMCTGYILIALVIEERTLIEMHGEAYEDYRRRVPKLIPRFSNR